MFQVDAVDTLELQ